MLKFELFIIILYNGICNTNYPIDILLLLITGIMHRVTDTHILMACGWNFKYTRNYFTVNCSYIYIYIYICFLQTLTL